MKTLQLLPSLFLSLLFLPFIAFSSRPFPMPPVIGIDGKELKLGKSYYLLSSLFPLPTGLCLVDNAVCPDDVVQCPAYYSNIHGLPVTFSAVVPTEDTVIREGTSYHIEFSSVAGNCSDKKFWYIKEGENYPNMEFVAIGGNSSAVEFKITKDWLGYKIVHCVTIPIPPIPICYGLGLVPQSGYNRLGVGLGVNPVQFFVANATASNSSTMDKLAIV